MARDEEFAHADLPRNAESVQSVVSHVQISDVMRRAGVAAVNFIYRSRLPSLLDRVQKPDISGILVYSPRRGTISRDPSSQQL